MCTKLGYLVVSLGLLCGLTQMSHAGALVAHWALDDGAGAVATDSTGNGFDGTIGGTPNWITGMVDGALDLDGSTNYIDVNKEVIRGTCSVALWLRPRDLPYSGGYRAILHVDAWNGGSLHGHLRETSSLFNFDINGGGGVTSTTVAASDEWYHLAGTFDTATSTSMLYLNGTLEATSAGLSSALYVGPLNWGAWTENQRYFNGAMDDIRIYNRVLGPSHVQGLVDGIPPTFLKAENPDPADGAIGVTMPLLQWSAGETGLFHNVYLGTSPELTPADQVGARLPFTMHYHVMGLVPGTLYYWRVDEVEADGVTTHEGDVWTFTSAPTTAYAPSPPDGQKWVATDAVLTWELGQGAIDHEVYFGTDMDAVANRDASVFMGSQLTATYEPGPLEQESTYYWAVDEISAVKHEGDVWSFTTIGPGAGVKGEYFSGMTLQGVPALTRVESDINFNWGDPGGPGDPIGVDGFSARWTADLEIAVADSYTFITTTDDGARLWLNGELIIDQWVDQGATDALSAPIALEPGIYSLRMEYYENTGGAVAQLSWRTPNMARQIIPGGPLQEPVRAKPLYPSSGAVDVPQDVALTWGAGEKAATHDVYFGDDEAAVASATPADAGIYRGSQPLDETTFNPGALEWGKTYYWRIDEVNPAEPQSPWKGSVMRFTTANFIVVDDFESYTDDVVGRIFQTWIDGWGYTEPPPGDPGNGTSATVGYLDPPFAEQTIVHGGRQAMPLDYNNIIPPYYSETERTWAAPQDWTAGGVTDLSLWVRGYQAAAGVNETAPGAFSVTGEGADIWGASDQFTFIYKALNSDGSLVARVVSNGQGTNTWAKAGVMVRDTLAAGSTHAMQIISAGGGNGASFQWRPVADDVSSNSDAVDVVAPPYWVKIERFGNSLSGYLSPNGTTWTQQGMSEVIFMTNPCYIGLCVTSHVAGTNRTFEFDSVTVSGAVGQWQAREIGLTRNDPATLYVGIQDSTGAIGIEPYADTSIVNATEWTEWPIPLTEFAGVSLNRVKKMFIGVGNRDFPQPGGHGMLFIDDVRVLKPAPVEP